MVSLKTAVRTRRVKSVALRLAVLAAILLAAGFVAFAWRLPDQQVVLKHDADGIVVLTGGTSRIADALELLASHRGRRLLISGVNPGTTIAEIADENPNYQDLFSCCIDFDYSALNTHGNAVQTRLWAIRHGYRSLIVVTSAYHMPRAMAELRHEMPEATLTAFPVLADRMRTEPWWSNGETARLVASEYVKYLFAELRMRFEPLPVAGGSQMSESRDP